MQDQLNKCSDAGLIELASGAPNRLTCLVAGKAGQGEGARWGRAGQGRARQGWTSGQGRAWTRAANGRGRECRAAEGRAGQGRAIEDRIGHGWGRATAMEGKAGVDTQQSR